MPTDQPVAEGPQQTLDLSRLIAIKWGDKTIDPAEVKFVLTPLPGVECPQCHQPAGRPHTEYCTLEPGKVWDGVLPTDDPTPWTRCRYPIADHGDGRGCGHDDCPKHGDQ